MIREFFENKAKESGYEDFLHWIDCYDYEKQPDKIVEWTTELVKNCSILDVVGQREQNLENKDEALHMADVIASAEFKKDLEKAIEEGNDVGYNADGGYSYYSKETALREVLKVIKKHFL